ncbi:maspardin isoform X2 [Mangifera indica]|uniref:maspardin isoform X2 n=1 Tax=Mangifera indica TaxID=29780 RepID=UPI001CF9FE1A|nr:maspardin isoform X2 [Mangifera indica]
MKGVFSAPGDFVHFKSQIGTKQWRYYDFGPKVVPPLICLPGTAGTAEVYYKQIMSLSMKGYRVISVDIPHIWNHREWIQAFEKFLDAIDVHHIHLYGTSLGGFLAQLFAQHRPRRVRSLVLSNTFLDTRSFAAAMPWAPIVSWTPSFLLKRYILTGIRDGPQEPFIADSVDFVVSQIETLSREDLASRLTLTVDAASVGTLLLSDSYITIMDTNDYCATPQLLKDQLRERYPEARRAFLKSGGDFPFLSRPDEVNLHLQLHLRRVGVDAQPDLVRGISKDGSGGNHSEKNDGNEEPDNPPKDEEGNSGSPSAESQLPPESSESHNLDDPPLGNSLGCLVGHGGKMLLLPCELLRKQQITAAEILLQIALEIYVLYMVETLNLTSLCRWKFLQLL